MFNWKGERNLAFLLYSLVLRRTALGTCCLSAHGHQGGAPEARRGRNQGDTSLYKKTPGRTR